MDIIDRRENSRGKSVVNRQRFLERHRARLKKAVEERIGQTKIQDIAAGSKNLGVARKSIHEPEFQHSAGGVRENVVTGNKEFVPGDRISRPVSGAGAGSRGAPDGESEDDFVFNVSEAEFLDFFFEGLELPDLVKRALSGEESFRWRRAGFRADGPPNTLDVRRTMRYSKARRFALQEPKSRKKRDLEETLYSLRQQLAHANGEEARELGAQIAALEQEIAALANRIRRVPFLDTVDLRYRRFEKEPTPIAQAVMFCLMDVSGSMGQWEKEMAKRFFMLLYLFLRRNYQRVEVVFIRHHHTAEEVGEEEFFQSRESGGTVVSTCLVLMEDIVKKRYPLAEWNVYACQASDGDNFGYDVPVTCKLLRERILPLVQYYAYVELQQGLRKGALWQPYQEIAAEHPRFATAHIQDRKDIYPVFRGLFEPKEVRAHA